MAPRKTYTLEGETYTTQKAFLAAFQEEFRALDPGDAYDPDDLIRDVILASPWMPDEWVDEISIYKVEPGTDDFRFPDRKADQMVVWIKLLDGERIRLGWKGMMQTRAAAFSSWMREAVEEDIEAFRAEVRLAGGYDCAWDGKHFPGTRWLQIDHDYEFNHLLRDFLQAYTGKADATADDIEFAHPRDEVQVKDAFIEYHREHASLQPMCKPHNAEKERLRRLSKSKV